MEWKRNIPNVQLAAAKLQWLHRGIVSFREIIYLKVSVQHYRPIEQFADGEEIYGDSAFLLCSMFDLHQYSSRSLDDYPIVTVEQSAQIQSHPSVSAQSFLSAQRPTTVIARKKASPPSRDEAIELFWQYLQAAPNRRHGTRDLLMFEWLDFLTSMKLDRSKYPEFRHVIAKLVEMGVLRTTKHFVIYTELESITDNDDFDKVSEQVQEQFICELCSVVASSLLDLASHLTGRKHLLSLTVRALQAPSSKIYKDKFGVTISQIKFTTMNKNQLQTQEFVITNSHNQAVTLVSFGLLTKITSFKIDRNKYQDSVILPGKTLRLPITFNARNYGRTNTLIAFNFGSFCIARQLSVSVQNVALAQELQPSEPYQRRERKPRPRTADVIPGERPPGSTIKYKHPLKQYTMPAAYQPERLDFDQARLDLASPLTASNYASRWKRLMYLEEAQLQDDIRIYDMQGVRLAHSHPYLSLKVPGLAEKRPSVLYGDSVFVSFAGESKEYEGCVHHVNLETVLMKFHRSFHQRYVNGLPVNVRFSFTRVPMRRMHQAVELVVPEFLFPVPLKQTLATTDLPNFSLFNSKLNPLQVRAVKSFFVETLKQSGHLGDRAVDIPFIIWGPPGTGKTVTLIEIIKQLLRAHPTKRILAAAPSNQAADLICERLARAPGPIGVREMFRMNAISRPVVDMDVSLRQFSHIVGDRFVPQALDALRKYRVIVTTCVTAGLLYSMGIPVGHFDFICVDEAGQATEPEGVIPLCVAGPCTRLVLAGDPKQLGPIVRSRLAEEFGLGKSLLERLMELKTYDTLDSRVCVKLTYNYRSHPSILKLPSQLFYNNDLVAEGNRMITYSLAKWEGLITPSFPLIFHGVVGKDMREGNSPSWFNVDEIAVVVDYVKALLQTRTNRISVEDIGIISPYRKQVDKLRRAVRSAGIPEPDKLSIGSVEQFQGQERLVIIISAVRSNTEHLAFDYHHNLGFLRNPKRFNVSITRPKALLIVVGNPHVLSNDSHWNKLLLYARSNGGYTGEQFMRPEDEESALHAALVEHQIAHDNGAIEEEYDVDDKDWRDNQ